MKNKYIISKIATKYQLYGDKVPTSWDVTPTYWGHITKIGDILPNSIVSILASLLETNHQNATAPSESQARFEISICVFIYLCSYSYLGPLYYSSLFLLFGTGIALFCVGFLCRRDVMLAHPFLSIFVSLPFFGIISNGVSPDTSVSRMQ